jgi:hypothetical protein
MPDGDDTPPDPDALLIAEAVAGLDSLIIDLDDVDLLDDAAFEELTAEEKQDAHLAARSFVLDESGRLRSSLSATVITLAVLEREPPTRVVEPVKRPIVTKNGRPAWFVMKWFEASEWLPARQAEVDGYDFRRRRPYLGAYRKFGLEPNPAPIVAERIEYQAWRYALEWLCTELSGKLERFEPLPNRAPWWPWQRGAG